MNDASTDPREPLSRERMIEAFGKLSNRLGQRGVQGEICLLGGAAMCLGFNARESTTDVDALLMPADEIRDEARAMACDDEKLPLDWLNDAAVRFLPKDREPPMKSPCFEFEHLRVYTPPAEYLLAMKVRASRLPVPGESGDVDDIGHLLSYLNINDPAKAWSLVAPYYPPEKFPAHAKTLLEDLCRQRSWPIDEPSKDKTPPDHDR